MTDQTIDISPVLSDEELAAFIEYLDDDHMTDGSFWYEISFMERHDIDIAFYSRTLMWYAGYDDSPVYQKGGLPQDSVRRIALQLRDVIRHEHGLPQLSDEEKRAWRFEMPYGYEQLRLPYVEDGTGTPFTDAQVAAAIDYAKTHYPEIIRYMAIVKYDRATYTPAPENENKHWIRMSVVRLYMNNAVFYTLKPGQQLNFHGETHADWKVRDMIYDSL